MRQGQNPKRSRGRGSSSSGGNSGGGRRNPPGRSQNHDSNGPNIRIRGNASQVYEKYLVLARDAHTAGDRIAAENYLQHADHYFRIFNADSGGDSQNRGRDQGGAQRNGNGNGNDRAPGDESSRFDAADAPQPQIEAESQPQPQPQPQPQVETQTNGSGGADADAVVDADVADAPPAPKRRGRPPGRPRTPRVSAKTKDTSPAAED